MYKMVPKGRYGGILQPSRQREPLILNIKTPKAQAGADLERMTPIKSIATPQLSASLNTSTLEPMPLKAVNTAPTTNFNTNGAIGLGASLAGSVIDAVSPAPEVDQYGLQEPESAGASIGKGAASGAAAGAMFGPWGAAIGGVIGGATGLLSSNKANKEYEKARLKSAARSTREQDAQMFQTMSAKDGMKFGTKIEKMLTSKTTMTPIFKVGGKLHSGTNVITKGKLHKENNNLGNRDKGIPVIDAHGNKEYELEKEEWVVTSAVTKELEAMAEKYNKSNSDDDLESLGRFIHKQLLSNTQDNSQRYGIGEKK